MKPLRAYIVSLLILLQTATSVYAEFGNEWIEHNLTYYKFNVTKQGIYRISYNTLSSIQGANFSGTQISKINLWNNGQAVPLYIYDSNVIGSFDSGDFIEFYGEPNDGSFDSNLYANPETEQPNPHISLFNDTAVYFLVANSGKPNMRITNTSNGVFDRAAMDLYYMHTLRYSFADDFQPGREYLVGGDPIHESIFAEGEGFGSQDNSGESKHLLQPAQIYTLAPVDAHINANIIMVHQSGQQLLEIHTDFYQFPIDTFYNTNLRKFRGDLPLNKLTNFQYLYVNASGRKSIAMVEVIYPHEFSFPGKSKSDFTLNPSLNSQARHFEISSFGDTSTALILYDLTHNFRIVGAKFQIGQTLKFSLPAANNEAGRALFVTSQKPSDLVSITSLQRVNFINYYNSAFQGNYIILSHPKLREGAVDYVGDYAKYRHSIEGGGHEVEVVTIDQLYDQFAYGIKKHPLAIRNFIDFALDEWSIKPEHLFIIGKGREYVYATGGGYEKLKYNAQMYAQCLVPTFGNPASDALLTATNESITPRVAVGRIAVENPADINIYLEKVKAYERVQSKKGDPYQTIDDKGWMKHIMHLGGGEGAAQQNMFKGYLEGYEDIIEDTLFGGTVFEFYKTTTDPIEVAQSPYLLELINSGISLITFFGHSSPRAFDFNIDPTSFSNFEKYHMVLSNGCFTGNIHNPEKGISGDFVFADGKAAVAFISTITFSSSSALYVYSDNFYKNLGRKNYGNTIGNIMKGSTKDVETYNGAPINRTIAEEMTLHGDPGLRLYPHAKPDYALEQKMVSFEPATVNIEDESFKLKVIVTNLGRAVNDSVNLIVTRFFPDVNDGSVSFVKRIKGTNFSDTIYFTMPIGSTKAFGINTFYIKVDENDEVSELSETNNTLNAMTLNITSEDVFPIYPSEFAIVPNQPITLKASTANVFAPVNTYRFEIDTTELFNSPLRDSIVITQSGGVLSWTPGLNYMDSVVYYWRVGVEGSNIFHNTSLIYLDGEYPGWNQSHYFQYLKDNYSNVYLDTQRTFKFNGDVKSVTVKTGTADLSGGPVPWEQIAHYVNTGLKHRWVCGGTGFPGGLVLAVFDSVSGNNWISRKVDMAYDPVTQYTYNAVHKNIHCKERDLEGFDFPTSSWTLQDRLVTFINNVPDGNYILAYSVNSASYNNWKQELINAFVDLGSQEVNNLTCCGNIPWAFFVKKGNPGAVYYEEKGSGINSVLNFEAYFTAQWNQGNITSTLIGPAYEWGSVHWKYHALEPQTDDDQTIDIIGVTSAGSETVLHSGLSTLDYSIQAINAATYPYIKLKLHTTDDTTRTPTQLDYWRVLYKKVPEAALSPNIHFTFTESITLGENINLSVACENVTEIPMDSLLVKYTLMSSGYSAVNKFVRYDSLQARQTMNLDWNFNSDCNCLGDINTLIVEVNPVPPNSTDNIYDQPEQSHYNNIGVLTFGMDRDRVNPLLDVTFDGVHILDGDIVSAYPEILISLKDENKFLLLNDTSLVNVFIVDPNSVQVKMRYDDVTMRFDSAASGTNNTAKIWLKKEFEQNGKYTLMVQAKDRSRNISGTYGIPGEGIDYRISFEVIREAMITNVLNYPNPFTSSTRFVFTLTGVQPPDYFKIQIMTVSGKVVRELTQHDLGQLHIGRNITEYGWDGTDEYGDPLANGIYLYRVVANIDGKSIDKWEEGRPDKNTDKYFKSGFGKMYLAR